MFNLFTLLKPASGQKEATALEKQIDQYCRWKAVRYPQIATTQRYELMEFFNTYPSLVNATLIGREHIESYVSQFPAEYRRQHFTKVLRGFMRYWYKMGLLTEEFASVVKKDIISDMENVHPLMHVDQVRRVQKYRQEGMPFAKIKLLMETEDGRKYDIHSVHRWSKYRIPDLSTGKS